VLKDARISWDIECSLWCRWGVEGCPVQQKRRWNHLWFWSRNSNIL